jgi:CAAX prenyl protease-like protein
MIAYILPFILYLACIQVMAEYPEQYAWLYPAAALLVSTVTVGLLRGRRLLRPHRHVLTAVFVGLVGITLWIGLCRLRLEEQAAPYLPCWLQPKRSAFDPFRTITGPFTRWAFIAVRLGGLIILVPVIEELFWRGFLLRWLISPDWQHVKMGQFSGGSFIVVTLLFALTHCEWLAAFVYCSLLNGLLYWKGDFWNCVVAHGVSNLLLGIYLLSVRSWELW